MDYDRKITTKWIGSIIRKAQRPPTAEKLGLKTHQTRDGFLIPHTETTKLERFYEKYGIGREADADVGSAETTSTADEPASTTRPSA
jgi:hypothetical protein